jgi:hypothetical protein
VATARIAEEKISSRSASSNVVAAGDYQNHLEDFILDGVIKLI